MRKIMTNIPKDTVGFTMPSSVVASQVEMYTYPAKLPSENTPSDLIKTEYFKKEHSQQKYQKDLLQLMMSKMLKQQ